MTFFFFFYFQNNANVLKIKDSIYNFLEYSVDEVRQYFAGQESKGFNSVLFGGLIGALFSFLQFISSAIIGAASDIYGRKSVLLLVLVILLIWTVSCLSIELTRLTIYFLDRNVAFVHYMVCLKRICHFLDQSYYWRHLKGQRFSCDRYHDRSNHRRNEILSYGIVFFIMNLNTTLIFLLKIVNFKGFGWNSIFIRIPCRSLHRSSFLFKAVCISFDLFLPILFGHRSHFVKHSFCCQVLQGISSGRKTSKLL